MTNKNLVGRQIGKLTVIEQAPSRVAPNGKRSTSLRYWKCLCECGQTTEVQERNLLKKKRPTRSCGCLRHETKPGLKHGRCGSKEYEAWRACIRRCSDPNDKTWSEYGGRGIKVCSRWLRFENFLEDMGEAPSSDYSLGRKDNDGDYCPENCRWETWTEQANNKRNNQTLIHNGEAKTIAEWAKLAGLKPSTLRMRLTKYGMSIAEAIERPIDNHKRRSKS